MRNKFWTRNISDVRAFCAGFNILIEITSLKLSNTENCNDGNGNWRRKKSTVWFCRQQTKSIDVNINNGNICKSRHNEKLCGLFVIWCVENVITCIYYNDEETTNKNRKTILVFTLFHFITVLPVSNILFLVYATIKSNVSVVFSSVLWVFHVNMAACVPFFTQCIETSDEFFFFFCMHSMMTITTITTTQRKIAYNRIINRVRVRYAKKRFHFYLCLRQTHSKNAKYATQMQVVVGRCLHVLLLCCCLSIQATQCTTQNSLHVSIFIFWLISWQK